MVSSLRDVAHRVVHCLWSVRKIINIEINILKLFFSAESEMIILSDIYYLQIYTCLGGEKKKKLERNHVARALNFPTFHQHRSRLRACVRVCLCAYAPRLCVWLRQKYMTGRAERSCRKDVGSLAQTHSLRLSLYHYSLALRHPLPLSFQSHASQWEWFPWQRHTGISGLWLWCISVCVQTKLGMFYLV